MFRRNYNRLREEAQAAERQAGAIRSSPAKYILFSFALDIIEYITVPDTLSEELRAERIYFQRTMEEIIDFIKW
ncbi:MAG: hypothetical protein IIZ56_04225, partial [Clostridia bacterium]|nr:hypothetical protein [Clostridia bacterium]